MTVAVGGVPMLRLSYRGRFTLFGNDYSLPKRARAQLDADSAKPNRFLRFAPVIQGSVSAGSGGLSPKGHY